MGVDLSPEVAFLTRPGQKKNARPNNNPMAGGNKNETKRERELNKITEHVKFVMESCRGWLEAGPKLKSVEDNLGPVLEFIQALAQEKEKREGNKGQGTQEKALGAILERLDKMEKSLATASTSSPARQGSARTTPLWSEVAVGGKTKAVVEVRMTPMEGAEKDSDEEKLRKIKVSIPDARAIIPHPRTKGKISVVVPSTTRRDQILAVGIDEQESIKLIRKPKLVMVMGVPIDTKITTGDSTENIEWMKTMEVKNAIRVMRVEWLYRKDRLEKIRKAGVQKKGSIIIEVASEADQARLVREGLLHGALWLPAKIWDVEMKAVQCFKCWKWGHTQSVCNAHHDTCGHCAKAHSTRDCTTRELKDARCGGCKRPGHFAWMTRVCEAHKEFRSRQKRTEDRLGQATLAIQNGQGPSFQPLGSHDGFTLVEKSAKKRKVGPGRPIGTTSTAKAMGQMKFQFGATRGVHFGKGSPIPAETTTPVVLPLRTPLKSTTEC